MIRINWEALQDEIKQAGHGNKKAIVSGYAHRLGVSTDTIYRGLRKRFGKQKTAKRDQVIPQRLIDMVADRKIMGYRLHLAEREYSTENIIDDLVEEGVPGAEKLTVSTVNRRLAESGFRERDPKRRVEAEYANQEHQIDFSRSKYFQVFKYDRVREDYLLKVSGRELHYKDGDRRLRLWLAQVKESFSRCRLVRASAATSEDGFIGLDLMNWNFTRPQDAHCMQHLPWGYKFDRGAFSKRAEVQAAFKALEIGWQFSGRKGKSNKDSQGKVESGFRGIWQGFELKWAIKLGAGSTLYLSEYNDLLHEWLIEKDSQKKHPLKDDTREAVYRKSILTRQQRTIDIDVLTVACKVDFRTVPQTLMIQYGKEHYEAPQWCSDKRVRIYKNMHGELMGELVADYIGKGQHKPFVLRPYHFNTIGDFHTNHKPTYRQKRELEVDKQLAERKAAAAANGNRLYMPPREKQITPESPFVGAIHESPLQDTEFKNEWEARVYIGEQLRYIGASYQQYEHVFDKLLTQDLTKNSIDQVLDFIKQKQQKMRVNS